MGRKRKTRWRRLSIGEISANEDEDGELGVAVISLTRSHSHSQNHSPARHPSDKALSGVITMTNNNKDSSSSSPSLHTSSTNLSTPGGGSGGNNGGGSNLSSNSGTNSKILSSGSSSTPPAVSEKSQIPAQNASPCSSSSPNPHSQSNNSSGYHNGHNHVPSSYNNSTHPPPNSVSSNESSSSSTGAGGPGGGGHYNDRYHYTRENYRPPHHHHHHHHHNHHGHHNNSNYNGSSSSTHYQGSGEGGSSTRGERGGNYHYSGHPHSHKEYQNGYHGPSHYSGYQGSSYYRNSHNNYRNSHYSGSGGSGASGGTGGEPYNGGESEGYHYPPSSRPYGGRFRKSRTYPASSYYYPNGSSKTSGGASNNTSDNINRPSYNQDEYTKITTPRQDVLFKKGYLSQKKTQPSSSSVDSTSAATTPSASTNGTPDTQSTNGINSDNSEGYENGETDYVIPYDDTIYYAPPPPEAVFTDPNTGQVYYGHCSSTGEYYDAYPVSPVMVAAGYPPVYYPMVPYAPIEWNGVPAPMYPMIAAPAPPHQMPPIDDSALLSPGLQGLESSPATTNPNTNSDTTTSSAALPAGGTVATSPSADPSSNTPNAESNDSASSNPTMGADDDGEEECDHPCPNKEGHGSDSGLDSGCSVADDTVSNSAATSQGNSSGAEDECAGGNNSGAKLMINEENTKTNLRIKKQHSKQGTPPSSNNNNNSITESVGRKVNAVSGNEHNNNEGSDEKISSLGKDVEKLHLSNANDEYSSSESVLSSASSTDSGKATPPTLKSEEQEHEQGKSASSIVDTRTPLMSSTSSYNNSSITHNPMKGMMVISSHHPPHMTPTYNTAGGPHPQAIPVAAAPVMTTVPLQVGCPPVMIAAPTGMPLPPLVPTAPMHPVTHPPPPPTNGPVHHHPHHHGGGHLHHGQHPHQTHHNHHNMHHHHHPHPSSHPPPQQHGTHGVPPPTPVHHTNYSHHHNHHNIRHYGPHNHPPPHQNSPGQHHQPSHHLHMPPPSQPPNQQPSQASAVPQPPLPPPAVALGSAGPLPPPGSTPYHVYPHPTAYVYGPPTPLYNDEGSAVTNNAESNIFPSTAICGNLESTTFTATSFTGEQSTNLKGEMKTTSNEENGDKTLSRVSKHTSEEKSVREKGGGKSESISSTPLGNTKEELGAQKNTEIRRVTDSEKKVEKESCDLKLRNVVASTELNPEKTVIVADLKKKEEVAEGSGLLPTLTTKTKTLSSLTSYSAEREETTTEIEKAAVATGASLTLETPNKMNKEIEIRLLKEDMSVAGEKDEKVGSFTSLPQSPQLAKMGESSSFLEEGAAAQANVRNGKVNGEEDAATAAFVLTSSFPSSKSSSSPSSANESSTSSPVNDSRTSLMRSQSKLASRKKVVSEEDHNSTTLTEKSMGKSCNLEKKETSQSNNNTNSKKKQKKNSTLFPFISSSSSSQGNQNGNNNNTTSLESNKPSNLLENDHKSSKKRTREEKQMDNNNKEKDESKTTSATSEEANQESGQGSQNQMTSSNESAGPLEQESCSNSLAAAVATTTSQQHTEIENVNISSESCTFSTPSSSSSSSRKPTDLTVQCPTIHGNDEQFETFRLQQSPSLVHEPSSPDSLNTNQSVAGSEFAPGENLSMSESDFMNRTTSIDEIEEDLPQEVELPLLTCEQPSCFSEDVINEKLTKTSEASPSSSPLTLIRTEILPDASENINSTIGLQSLISDVAQNLGHNLLVEEGDPGEKTEPCSNEDETTEKVTVKEAIKSTTASPKATASSFSGNLDNNSLLLADGEEKTSEVPPRPQSITLAVTEWLKTQGDDALTPIIARASSSDEFEGDVEETTTDSDDEDFEDEDVAENGGRKKDDKVSNLEQNQKNVHGNPWVAPSNKSGYSTGKATKRRSRSKKNALKATENEGICGVHNFSTSDGVCSRVAPASSSNDSTTTMLMNASLEKLSNGKVETNFIIANNKYLTAQTSTCSTSTSDDQDDFCNLTDMNNILHNNGNRKKDKHNPVPNNSTDASKLCLEIISKNNINIFDSSNQQKTRESHVSTEQMKDYDSGMELSSPENSTSSNSMKLNGSTATTTAATFLAPNIVMNINQKSALSANSPLKSFLVPTTTAVVPIMESKADDNKWKLPSFLHRIGGDHNKYINTDQVVIAAPLIVETHSTKASPSCSHKKTGNINENERKESDSSPSSLPPPTTSSFSSLLAHNNGRQQALLVLERSNNNVTGGGDAQSLGSVPSSFTSIDDRHHAEICDPQRYAKYYQFGVVFDTSDDPDQGIDTSMEEESEIDSFQDIGLDSPQTPPRPSSSISSSIQKQTNAAEKYITDDKNEQREPPTHHQKDQQKNTEDFLAIMIQRNRKVARKAKKSGGVASSISSMGGGRDGGIDERKNKETYNNDDLLVSKSVYLQDQDEEIGTFDPKVILQARLQRASKGGGGIHPSPSIHDESNNASVRDALDYDYTSETGLVGSHTASAIPRFSQQSHLYINPLSLAAELSGSEMGKDLTNNPNNNNKRKKKKKKDGNLEDDDDIDSSSSSIDSSFFGDDEPPLPPYESPPSVEIPVYNANTPAARVIRQKFYPIGDPVSGAICCSIQ